MVVKASLYKVLDHLKKHNNFTFTKISDVSIIPWLIESGLFYSHVKNAADFVVTQDKEDKILNSQSEQLYWSILVESNLLGKHDKAM